MIRVLFFAELRAKLGSREFRLEDFSGSVEELRTRLCKLFPDWRGPLQSNDIQVAINWDMSTFSAEVRSGDEVAFFPPVTGG